MNELVRRIRSDPWSRFGLAGAALAVAGCATNPPLMFGDTTTFGLRLGNDTATAGGSVSLGYKAQSVAVVPVSVLDHMGVARLLKGHGISKERDALSVFASFDSTASAPGTGNKDSNVRLGQVFSTGLAAQALTLGYLCRENADPNCNSTAATSALEAAAAATYAAALAASAAATANSAAAKATSVVDGKSTTRTSEPAGNPAPSDATDRPYQAPLIFLRTDLVGIDIGGSLAEQGLQFNLGYTNRNLALIPVYAPEPGRKVVGLYGTLQPADPAGAAATMDAPHDAYSVLGQFKANTQTTQLGFGLERYFATGVAARYLGEATGAAIAHTRPETAKPAAATASAAAAGQ